MVSLPQIRCLTLLLLATATGCGLVAQNRNAQGIRYYNRGQIAVAQSRFEAAKQANPQNADSYYNLGAIAHLQGLLELQLGGPEVAVFFVEAGQFDPGIG